MIKIDENKCITCGKCIKDCISNSLSLLNNKVEYNGACIECGHCVAICPTNAVSIPTYDMEMVENITPMGEIPIDTFLSTLRSRRSIRDFSPKKIEKEKLENILEAGRFTPTAKNSQANHFIIVQDRLDEFKKILYSDIEKAFNQDQSNRLLKSFLVSKSRGLDYLFRNAPAVIYIASNNPWDAGMANQNLELAGYSQGLGVLHNGYLQRITNSSKNALDFLQVRDLPVVTSILIGYPLTSYERTVPGRKLNYTWL